MKKNKNIKNLKISVATYELLAALALGLTLSTPMTALADEVLYIEDDDDYDQDDIGTNEPDKTVNPTQSTDPSIPSNTEPTEPTTPSNTEPSNTEPTEPTSPSNTEPTNPSNTEPTSPSTDNDENSDILNKDNMKDYIEGVDDLSKYSREEVRDEVTVKIGDTPEEPTPEPDEPTPIPKMGEEKTIPWQPIAAAITILCGSLYGIYVAILNSKNELKNTDASKVVSSKKKFNLKDLSNKKGLKK